jgi:N utilization substance protein B
MASRRKGRIIAFQALFSWEANGRGVLPEDIYEFSWLGDEARANLDEDTRAFARLLISGVVENQQEIDSFIQKHLKNWELERLNKVDLAILRLSVYTLLFQGDIAPGIVIDEAIGISRQFGADDSYKFINGVLDNIRKDIKSIKNEKPV